MALRKLAKDESSGKHGCPTVYAEDAAGGMALPLVVQGDVVEALVGARLDAAVSVGSEWQDDGYVLVQGPELAQERQGELENVLPGEAAVSVTGESLFRRGGRLRPPREGQLRLRIKAETVCRAMAARHEEPR